jgi:hypothetical protein
MRAQDTILLQHQSLPLEGELAEHVGKAVSFTGPFGERVVGILRERPETDRLRADTPEFHVDAGRIEWLLQVDGVIALPKAGALLTSIDGARRRFGATDP